jgi:hypothetical protein
MADGRGLDVLKWNWFRPARRRATSLGLALGALPQLCCPNEPGFLAEPFMRPICLAAALALVAAIASPAPAQNAPPKIIRGEIAAVDGANVAVRTRGGETIRLHLKDSQTPLAIVPAELSDIKPGVFVGAAAMPAEDGALRAIEVHIFPESMRGTGEGFRPFDLASGSTMTNANVSSRVDAVSGPKLTLTYKGGEKTLIVDKATPIVAVAPGEASDIKPGASIDIFGATQAADGAFEAGRIVIGRNGTKVPM